MYQRDKTIAQQTTAGAKVGGLHGLDSLVEERAAGWGGAGVIEGSDDRHLQLQLQ